MEVQKIFMARNASLVPITAACSSSRLEAEADVYVWFVRLFKSYVTGSEAKGKSVLCAFYLMLSTF
jgi:hypothetical protein